VRQGDDGEDFGYGCRWSAPPSLRCAKDPYTDAVKELPLFDARVPIACTLGAGQRSDRRDLLQQMRAATQQVERTEAGVLVRFPSSADGLFEQFSISEKQCCAFFGFRFDSQKLMWEAPPDASGMMDAIYRFFSDPTYSIDELELLSPG
jgi:hypothetical protein